MLGIEEKWERCESGKLVDGLTVFILKKLRD